MVCLTELPSEILVEIFSHLSDNRRLLRRATQCRLLTGPIRQALYRHVILSFDATNRNNLDLFIRSLQETPSLGLMVRSLWLSWSDTPWSDTPRRDSNVVSSHVTLLLKLLMNLRSVKLQRSIDSELDTCSQILQKNPNTMSNLRELTLGDSRLTIDDFVKCMFLDNLETLRFFSLKDPALVTAKSLPLELNGNSSVSYLDLGTIRFPATALASIMQWPRRLKRLRTTLTGFVELPNAHQHHSIRQPGVNFSPETLGSILAPTRDSLEALEILPEKHCFWPPHDGTQLNLIAFSSLKQVIIPSDCYWPSNLNGKWKSHSDRNGIHLLLPESLVQLEVCILPPLQSLVRAYTVILRFRLA